MLYKSLSGDLLEVECDESLRTALNLPYHHILTVFEDTFPRLFLVEIVTITPRVAATLLVFVPFQSFLTNFKMNRQEIDELNIFPSIPYPFENYLERYQELVHNPELVIANQPRNFITKLIHNRESIQSIDSFDSFDSFETLKNLPDLTTPEMREWFDILSKEYKDIQDVDCPSIKHEMMVFLNAIDTKYGLFADDMDFVQLVQTVAEYLSLFSMYFTEANLPFQLAVIVSKYKGDQSKKECYPQKSDFVSQFLRYL